MNSEQNYDITKENYTNTGTTSINNEALQNIASIYNNKNLIVENVDVTNTMKANNGNITNLNATTFNIIPRGVIVAWFGTNIPNGWALCDGNNGTPDLRNRFIRGSDSTDVNVQRIGGSVKIGGSQLPPHTHNFEYSDNYVIQGASDQDQEKDRFRGAATGITYTIRWNNRTNRSTVVGSGDDYWQPYYKLLYIMKL